MNKQWQVQTFCAVLAAQLQNSQTAVDTGIAEVQDLISRGYLVPRNDLPKNGVNTVIEVVRAANITPANLVRDLGLGTDDATIDAVLGNYGYDVEFVPFPATNVPAPAAPAVATIDTPATAPVFHEQQAQAAVTPAQAPATAQTQAQQVNLPHVGEPAHVAPIGTAPVGQSTTVELNQGAAVPEVKPAYGANEAVTLGAGQAHAVVGNATVKDQTFEIEVGVPFSKKATGFTKGNAPKREWKPTLPFEEIANAKISYGHDAEQLPSFHVPNSTTQKISGMVRRASDEYAKRPVAGINDLITFRATNVDETDPKGAGVRVYAMWLSKAPAVKTRTKKTTEAK